MDTPEKPRKNYRRRPVLQYTLEGDFVARHASLKEAADSLGMDVSEHICKCCRGYHCRSVAGYLWRYQEYENFPKKILPYEGYTYVNKRIRQYDMEGNFLKEWHSARDLAAEFGITPRMIYRACANGTPCHGYHLWYTDQVMGKPYNKRGGTRKITKGLRKKLTEGLRRVKCKPVLQYDLEGNLVREWPSGSEAMRKTGFDKAVISAICHGKGKTYKGYVWRFKECEEQGEREAKTR